MKPLADCGNLFSLVIDKTQIQSIDLSPLDKLETLKGLNLSNNQLTIVDLTPLVQIEEMLEINLEENPLESLIVRKGFTYNALKVSDETKMIESNV